ncbi:DUF262 domain-containing protein [Selenomonas sp. AB3002]|uniref:GmrSD restriction endonuclease domain-containing protein n=1 Tax=Selenomonas sp. AB3002 TaxID=1392502 RepID=UPI000690AD96
METVKFELKQYQISSILGMIEAGQFVIPEIQRPFVWKRSQVRDLIDSLYNGYPTGYIITWKNPDVQIKDGTVANGNHVLIDGQQRITAIMAAISGLEVLDEDFNKDRIKIAFNPLTEDKSKRFAVQDASHLKDKRWIPDISLIFRSDFDSFTFSQEYSNNNPDVTPSMINSVINKLKDISYRQIGVIELAHSLDIDEVTEIFIRINSKGTALSQSDFVMSKMAADVNHGGNKLRKVVDYFCHLAVKPDFYEQMTKDEAFVLTPYAEKIRWLYHDNEELYIPTYSDMLRVAFMHKFDRAKLADLVSLLSGRDFETKEFREEIIEDSYTRLEQGINDFINENNFKNFILAIRSAGFRSNKLLNSKMTLDFAYMLYLNLLKDKETSAVQVKRYVQKWFVLSTLTGRYVGSPESVMSRDIRLIREKGYIDYFREVEDSTLSDTFWNVTLPQNLETSSANSPAFNTFLAAQINQNSNSLFQTGTMVSDLVEVVGDIHHIFPKAYLKKNGIDNKSKYNQVANYIYLDTHVNTAISDSAPSEYFATVCQQCDSREIKIGNITDREAMMVNLSENAIPETIFDMNYSDYDYFLLLRRKMMAKFIEMYYKGL